MGGGSVETQDAVSIGHNKLLIALYMEMQSSATVLKSSNLLATLINDGLDLSRLEDGSLQLDIGAFSLHSLLREAINLIKPIASVKKFYLTLNAPDLPEYAIVRLYWHYSVLMPLKFLKIREGFRSTLHVALRKFVDYYLCSYQQLRFQPFST